MIGAFRPPPGTHKRARLIKFVLLIALLLVGAVVFTVARFLSNLSFV